MHAVEKKNQHFRKEKIETAASASYALVQREKNDKIRAIYGAGSSLLSPPYQKCGILGPEIERIITLQNSATVILQ